ncbi:MAG: hypothetical protein ACRCVV_14305 [Shewanella sp.]
MRPVWAEVGIVVRSGGRMIDVSQGDVSMGATWAQAFIWQDGRWLFREGRGHYCAARAVAKACDRFIPDDEDEHIDDELRSCYNCQYRRWTVAGFECLALGPGSR